MNTLSFRNKAFAITTIVSGCIAVAAGVLLFSKYDLELHAMLILLYAAVLASSLVTGVRVLSQFVVERRLGGKPTSLLLVLGVVSLTIAAITLIVARGEANRYFPGYELTATRIEAISFGLCGSLVGFVLALLIAPLLVVQLSGLLLGTGISR